MELLQGALTGPGVQVNDAHITNLFTEQGDQACVSYAVFPVDSPLLQAAILKLPGEGGESGLVCVKCQPRFKFTAQIITHLARLGNGAVDRAPRPPGLARHRVRAVADTHLIDTLAIFALANTPVTCASWHG
ncbi:MAG: hypothetical protein FWD65_04345 [Coriobacteriia bacterium]|nr:hypothetical protein [Coriobacteriia bacterium]